MLYTHDLLGVLGQRLLCKARRVIHLENVSHQLFIFILN